MVFQFSKNMYPKAALIKAAYQYTPTHYVHLDANETDYLVELVPKEKVASIDIHEFKNELLAQTVRTLISKETGRVRELVMARAFASTIVEGPLSTEPNEEDFDLDTVLKDWFENHEELPVE